MKKAISLVLALVLILGLVGLVACGGNGDEADNGTTATPTAGNETEAPSSNSGLTWNDMPIYSGADQVQKGNWAIPADEEGWSKVEWRYYETGDGTANVIAFYKSEMPDQGWEEIMWMEAEGIAYAYYSKNNEADGAMFWCGLDEDENKTVFALMRATQ